MARSGINSPLQAYNAFQLIGGRRDGDEAGGGYTQAAPAAAPTAQAPVPPQGAPSSTEDDIPF